MKPISRPAALAWVVVLVSLHAACDLDSSGSAISFYPSGVPAEANQVRLLAPEHGAGGNRLTLAVAIGGWTRSDDVFAFNFGVLFDRAGPLEYVQGSAAAGPALEERGCPDPVVLVSPQVTGLTVAVSKLGACGGQPVGPDEQTILSLDFRLTSSGSTTIALGDSGPNSPSALDSGAQPIPSITFDTFPATISGW